MTFRFQRPTQSVDQLCVVGSSCRWRPFCQSFTHQPFPSTPIAYVSSIDSRFDFVCSLFSALFTSFFGSSITPQPRWLHFHSQLFIQRNSFFGSGRIVRFCRCGGRSECQFFVNTWKLWQQHAAIKTGRISGSSQLFFFFLIWKNQRFTFFDWFRCFPTDRILCGNIRTTGIGWSWTTHGTIDRCSVAIRWTTSTKIRRFRLFGRSFASGRRFKWKSVDRKSIRDSTENDDSAVYVDQFGRREQSQSQWKWRWKRFKQRK